MNLPTRRTFLKSTALASACELGFLNCLPEVTGKEAAGVKDAVRLRGEIEPVVRLLEETPRERLLEEVGSKVKEGKLSYREILAALQLAGVKNIQPRPVGFKFHAVLVVNSAHLASLNSPPKDRWLPIFWALDYFKDSQARDVREGNWTMAPVDEKRVPKAHLAEKAFAEAMENWDVEGADAAVAGLARRGGAHGIFEAFARFGARDFRDIGHKAIFVSNAFRTLENIGWEHSEPVLRSLAYALLDHEEGNPAKRDAPADRPWRENRKLAGEFPVDWETGNGKGKPAAELLPVLREGWAKDAAGKVVELLKSGTAAGGIWDVLLGFSGELLMRRPNILTLHAVTTANALYYAYRTVGDDNTRRMLLLQNASFLTLFRGDVKNIAGSPLRIDGLEGAEGDVSVKSIFEAVSGDRAEAARQVLRYCAGDAARGREVIDEARRHLFLRGTNAHDYKFSTAVLEDYFHLSPAMRDRFLAASVFNLKGSRGKENRLVARTRAALG